MHSKIKYFLIFSIFFYSFSEFFIRWVGPNIFSFMYEIDYVFNQVKKNDLFLDSWSMDNKQNFEKKIGWMKKIEDKIYDQLNENNKYNISIIGSSNGDERKTVDNNKIAYIDIFRRNLDNKIYEVINHSIGNHGFYQLAYTAEEVSKKYKIDQLIVATVAHTLSRPGKNYMSFMIRPTYKIINQELIIKENDYNMKKIIYNYTNAKKYFYVSPWLINFFYENRRYYFANFYKNFYKSVYKNSFIKISKAAKLNNSNATIVLLPSYFKFKHKKLFKELFISTLNEHKKELGINFFNIDLCVQEYFILNNESFKEHSSPVHPGNLTHEAWGVCLGKKIFKGNWK